MATLDPLVRLARAASTYQPRSVREAPDPRPLLADPGAAVDLCGARLRAERREVMLVLLLDTRHRLLGEPIELYRGCLDAITVRIGELFRDAIVRDAAALLLLHNHPAGDPTPSPEDARLTRSVVEAGRLLDVVVLDHVVVGRTGYTSLRAAGLGGF
jgi:DNA repair protein RadC